MSLFVQHNVVKRRHFILTALTCVWSPSQGVGPPANPGLNWPIPFRVPRIKSFACYEAHEPIKCYEILLQLQKCLFLSYGTMWQNSTA